MSNEEEPVTRVTPVPSHSDVVRAIADPGSFLKRGYADPETGESDYSESIPAWGARAVLSVLERGAFDMAVREEKWLRRNTVDPAVLRARMDELGIEHAIEVWRRIPAARGKLNASTVSDLITRGGNPKWETRRLLALALDMPEDWLL